MALKLNDSLKQNAISKSEMVIQKIKAHPENYIGLEAGRYNTGMFGGISSFPVTVTNNSPVMMDVVVVSINYIQNNEKVFKTESLIFNNLEPGETATLKAPKSPRGVKISAHIQTINPQPARSQLIPIKKGLTIICYRFQCPNFILGIKVEIQCILHPV